MNRTIGIIILVVIAILALGAALIVYNRGNLTPENVVSHFYDEWIQAKRNGDPIERGLHRESTYVTRLFGTSVAAISERQPGYDPVLCSSSTTPNTFQIISTTPVTSTSTKARSTVGILYADGQKAADVFLVKNGSWWRIDEIDCLSQN